jgi:NTE family protein
MEKKKSIFSRLMQFGRKEVIGLALSGGTTYGAAHAGVLKVLQDAGIQPAIVTGTSAGAIVGAAYCAGVPVDTIATLFETMDWRSLLRVSVRKHMSLFDTQPLEEFIKKHIGDIEFKDLQIPFAAIAADIRTGERVVLNEGPLAPAVRASSALPGLFTPVEIKGHLLVDGGIVDNLPVEQARAMGATYVIASDVSRRGKHTSNPANLVEVFLSTLYILQERAALVEPDECDCYIRPLVTSYSSYSFKEASKMIEEGKKAARDVLPKLKCDLNL